ncbi:PadR family transcriptional regulator [Clostridium akagii]|uniref:PadR family transcriptional regulator n=1 Tax=Clostridium akagii TaxID=91623 RepID=UPI000479D49C|nr:PadR family transcriptional regulator [Clostridium akagii]
MNIDDLTKLYLPMSETAYYILLSLTKPCHGYGIILKVEQITEGRIRIGAGTIYGTLSKFESDKLIEASGEYDRKKMYKITDLGKQILRLEYNRLCKLCENSKSFMGGL